MAIYKNGGSIMKNTNDKKKTEPSLYSCDSIITDVNKEFIKLTGFTRKELLGKSLKELGAVLKINSQILLDNISSKYSGYIFTKLLDPREMNISLFHGKESTERVYTFVEKLNSRLDNKLIFVRQAFIDNLSGVAIYSVPDLILLKANQKYFDIMDSPFNEERNSIGRPIKEIVTGFVGSEIEVICNTVIETQKTCYTKEFQFDEFERGTTYWDTSKTTIFENGKLKYIFSSVIEVTENVLKNQSLERQFKIIEQQKEQIEIQRKQLKEQNTHLISIIENLSEGVMVADSNGKNIMVNQEAKKLVYQCDKATFIGDTHKTTKAFDLEGNEILLENYPGMRALKKC